MVKEGLRAESFLKPKKSEQSRLLSAFLLSCATNMDSHRCCKFLLPSWGREVLKVAAFVRVFVSFDQWRCCAKETRGATRSVNKTHHKNRKADSTLRSSQAVPHPSTNRALRHLTSEFRRDPVHSTRYGRQRPSISEEHRTALLSVPERAHRYSATLLPCCPAMLLTSSHHGKKDYRFAGFPFHLCFYRQRRAQHLVWLNANCEMLWGQCIQCQLNAKC